jgi:PD-(D/E)XK nuclease superfamily
MTNPPRIYPSSAAFMVGNQVKAKSNSSCLRYQWARQHCGLTKDELHRPIASEYAGLGALDEFRYSTILDKKKIVYEREKPFKIDYKDCVISGRMDFDRADGIVVEKKSTTSLYMMRDHIATGDPDPGHAAQISSYLAFLGRPEGHLVASYYEMDEDRMGFSVIAERTWVFKLSTSNELTVDNVPYAHSIKDLARWYSHMQISLSNPCAVPARPIPSAIPYKSPCNFCPLKELCTRQGDSGTEAALYLEQAREAFLVPETPRSFKIEWNSARRKANREERTKKNV